MKFEENTEFIYQGAIVDASNSYVLMNLLDLTLASDFVFEKVLTPSSENFMALQLDDEPVVYDFENKKIVDRGFYKSYISGCGFLLIIKPQGIGYATHEGCKTSEIGEVSKVSMGIARVSLLY